jgi:hypothetical protein
VVEVTEQRNALTELVRQQVGTERGRRWSVRAFAERAVDPATGYTPSTGLIGKIIKQQGYTVTPELISALAVGLGLDRDIVAAAAHYQLIGYRTEELAGDAPAMLLRELAKETGDTPLARVVAKRWDEENRPRTRPANT